MTAHELAKLLLDGPDLMVTRRGFEGGAHEITNIDSPVPIHLNMNGPGSYCGPHEYCEADWCMRCEDENNEEPSTKAIHLS